MSDVGSYTADVPRAPSPRYRPRPRQWRDILTFALAQREAISVRSTVINHLRRTPTRAEITAARRAAHGLASSGQATILRVKPSGVGSGRGSAHLILARPGTSKPHGSVDGLADISIADRARQRFEPMVLVQDLVVSVELLAAAIRAIPAERLNQSDSERLAGSLDASLKALRQIRRTLKCGI
jgi:hypothetical protein